MLRDCPRRQDLGVCRSWWRRCARGTGLSQGREETPRFCAGKQTVRAGQQLPAAAVTGLVAASTTGDAATFTRGLHEGRREEGSFGGGWQTGPAITVGHTIMKSIQTDGRDFYVPRSETSNARCYREKGARTTPEVSPGPASPAKARRGWRWKLQHHQVYEMTNVLRGRTLQNEYTDLPVRTVARPPQAEGQEQDPAPAVLVIPPNFRPHQPPEHKTRDSDYKSPGLCSPFPPSWLPQG